MAKYDVVGRVDSVANDTGCLRLKKEINARTQKWHPYPSYQHHAHPAEAKKKKKKTFKCMSERSNERVR